MAGPNRVIPPLKVDPDGTFDSRYWDRSVPLPEGPQGPEGPEGPQGPKPVIVSTEEPLDGEDGDLWYNPDGIPEIGDPVGLTKTEADQLYPSRPEFDAVEAQAEQINGRLDTVETDVTAMPTVIAGNYTKRLANYGNDLAAAIADLPDSGAQGGEIQIDGEVPWGAMAHIPANIHLTGRGANNTALVMDTTASVEALRIDSKSDVVLGGFRIIVDDAITPTPGGGGVAIYGASERITIQDVTFTRPGRGINAIGRTGITPGVIRDLALLNVRVEDSPVSTGINLINVDGYVLRDVWACGNARDGVKLEANTRNGFISGGFFNDNGKNGVGGGINGYAGGSYFTMIGTEVARNNSDGASIKSGSTNEPAPEGPGYVQHIRLIGIRASDNAVSGIDINMTSSDLGNLSAPVMASTTVSDCLVIGNGSCGVLNQGRNTILSNVHAIRNGTQGFLDGQRAIASQYVNCVALANGQNSAGTYDAFVFSGTSGSVTNCYANGVDADGIATVADFAGLTPYHRLGFAFTATASGRWHMSGCASINHTASPTGNGIRCYGSGGNIQIHQDGTLAPNSGPIYGGVGSTYFKTSDPAGQYIKTSGAESDITGWQKVTAT